MAHKAEIPLGCWPAVLRDEHAAAYCGEETVERFLSRVGTVWPQPFIETGNGKGKFRAWRKMDLDRVIAPGAWQSRKSCDDSDQTAKICDVQASEGRRNLLLDMPSRYRKAGAPFTSETLGRDLLQAELNERAAIWNDRLAAWRNGRDPMREERDAKRHGTVEWLSEAYQKHDSFLERVSEFSRPDYRRVLRRICDLTIVSDSGLKFRVGDAKVNQIGVSTAEKIYKAFIADGAARSSEKVVTYCKAMWKRMLPHHPDIFNKTVGNPWEGVTVKRREKAVKGHVDRETVYLFAEGAIAEGRPELAAAAVLAFEFLMRPSSIGAGFCGWSGYRGKSDPDKIIVRHRKTESSQSTRSSMSMKTVRR